MHIPLFNVPEGKRFADSLPLYSMAGLFAMLMAFHVACIIGIAFPETGIVTFRGEVPETKFFFSLFVVALACASLTALFYVIARNVHRRGGMHRFR